MSAELTFPSAVRVTIAAFRTALRTPVRENVVAWAERNFRITKGPEPGRFRIARVPYMAEPIEAVTASGVRLLTLKWAAQLGKSTILRIIMAWLIDQDPADALYVMPTEDLAREIGKENVLPTIKKIPALRKEFTGPADDLKGLRYVFRRMTLFFAWAKSPATLAGRTCRYVIHDEVNKYPAFSGKEAAPVALADHRAKNYWNRFRMIGSTPTVESGVVSEEFAKSDQRYYWVPCVHCGHEQILIFQNLKYGADHNAERIEQEDDAWFECIACKGEIREHHKIAMLRGGRWVASRPEIRSHRGYALSTLYSPWVRWSTIAADFIRAKDDPKLLMDFTNSTLGQDWIEKAIAVTEDSVTSLKCDYPAGVIPLAAVFLTCAVDVQVDGIYYVVRAWGYGEESWLVDWGFLPRTKQIVNGVELWKDDDLERFATEIMPTQYEHANGSRMMIRLGGMDSGYRTDTVYAFCMKHPTMRPVKGSNETQVVAWMETRPRKDIPQLVLVRLDTHYYKEMVHGFRTRAVPCWHIPMTADAAYLGQVASEEKIIVRNTKGEQKSVWVLRKGYSQNHYWDAEIYAAAAADKLGLRLLRPTGTPAPRGTVRGGMKRADGRPFVSRRN